VSPRREEWKREEEGLRAEPGTIDRKILGSHWSPAVTTRMVLLDLLQMMNDPKAAMEATGHGSINTYAGLLLRTSPDAYETHASRLTREATGEELEEAAEPSDDAPFIVDVTDDDAAPTGGGGGGRAQATPPARPTVPKIDVKRGVTFDQRPTLHSGRDVTPIRPSGPWMPPPRNPPPPPMPNLEEADEEAAGGSAAQGVVSYDGTEEDVAMYAARAAAGSADVATHMEVLQFLQAFESIHDRASAALSELRDEEASYA